MKAAWGCEAPGQIYGGTWKDDEGTIYGQCPLKFIPASIFSFLEIYDFYKQFPGSAFPGYDSISPRFLKAWRYLENKINFYTNEVRNHG
jgi:hypothetical protein